jgi:hypothetical protein
MTSENGKEKRVEEVVEICEESEYEDDDDDQESPNSYNFLFLAKRLSLFRILSI